MAKVVRSSLLSEYGGRPLSAPIEAVEAGSSALVHVAAEVHEPLRPLDEDGEQVRRNDVDRQDLWAPDDAGVVDDRVERAQPVHLVSDRPRLVQVGQVSGDG